MTSVVVAIRNAARVLPALLESLAGQDMAGAWEVIAVDNGSDDRSAAVLKSFASRVPLRRLRAVARANPSYARNAGARAASGSRLLFVDADDAVAPEYVSAMARALDEHPLVTSRVDSASLNAEWVRDAHGPPWQADGVGVFFGFLPAAGINIGVHRDLFERLGGFPEAFSGSEDVAFSWRAQLAGVPLRFVGDAVYRYRYRDSLPGLFRQAHNWGRDSALLYATFRRDGMPGRTWRLACAEWTDVSRRLLTARGSAARAPLIVRLGFCVGRLDGSLRYGVPYL